MNTFLNTLQHSLKKVSFPLQVTTTCKQQRIYLDTSKWAPSYLTTDIRGKIQPYKGKHSLPTAQQNNNNNAAMIQLTSTRLQQMILILSTLKMLGLYLVGQNCLHLTSEQNLSSETYSSKYEKLPNIVILAYKNITEKMHFLKMSGPQIWL